MDHPYETRVFKDAPKVHIHRIQIHSYTTRLAAKQSYCLPKARTNYGIFNIRFQGPSVWNSIDEDIKSSSLSLFKKKMKQHLIKDY